MLMNDRVDLHYPIMIRREYVVINSSRDNQDKYRRSGRHFADGYDTGEVRKTDRLVGNRYQDLSGGKYHNRRGEFNKEQRRK